MESIAASLGAIGTGQLLLAFLFLGCYALALGPFAGLQGGRGAIAVAVLAGAGFVGRSESWEAGVILLALAPIAMAVFAGMAWLLSKAIGADMGIALQPAAVEAVSSNFGAPSLLQRLRARLQFT